jgi:hypothetical protein
MSEENTKPAENQPDDVIIKPGNSKLVISFKCNSQAEFDELWTIRNELQNMGEAKNFRDFFIGMLRYCQSQGLYKPE